MKKVTKIFAFAVAICMLFSVTKLLHLRKKQLPT